MGSSRTTRLATRPLDLTEDSDDLAKHRRFVARDRIKSGVVRHQPHLTPRSLECLDGRFTVDHRRDDVAVVGNVLLTHDHPVAVADGRVDHRITDHLEQEQRPLADEFAWLARTPANAGAQALAKAGKSIGDVMRVEVNEAFSSVAVNSVKMLGVDPDCANVNGGAVALGHPIGASGGRILGTMIHELRRNGGGLGLAAICSGGGQGDALLIEV